MANCEPYANGQGWWHVPGCSHVDWSEDMPGRALTPEQKKEITDRLLAAWLRVPAMRLGQLIMNATSGRDIFYAEDYPLIREIEEWK